MGDCEIQCPVDRIDPGQRSDGARVARIHSSLFPSCATEHGVRRTMHAAIFAACSPAGRTPKS
jgi:hypothetical protein